MSQIYMTYLIHNDVCNIALWNNFFSKLEELLHLRVSHLDIQDPIKREVIDIFEAASYVCNFAPSENRRVVFGKFGKSKIGLTLSLEKEVSTLPNMISLYFPESMVGAGEDINLLVRIFFEVNQILKPFYSICDLANFIVAKKKASGAVNLQEELGGIFWLTYLNKAYVDFFGLEKLNVLPNQADAYTGGIFIRLGKSPLELDIKREEAEEVIGRKHFVDTSPYALNKPLGKYALLFNKLNS